MDKDVPQIKQSHFYSYDNFGKYDPISTILSFLHSAINCERGGSKRCHLTSYLLPHYLVMGKAIANIEVALFCMRHDVLLGLLLLLVR